MVVRINPRASSSSADTSPAPEEPATSSPDGHLRWLVELTARPINRAFATTNNWVILTHALATRVSVEAQIFIVRRARSIWGKLGHVLKKSSWAQAFRKENLEPVYTSGVVKKWVPKQRALR